MRYSIKMVIYGIYRNNECVYIGQTRSPLWLRISKYRSDSKLGRNKSMLIIRAMIKYGFNVFQFKILEECFSLEKLDEAEVSYIKDLKPRYNIGGGGFYHKHVTPETRARMSAANRRRRPDQFRVQPVICLDTGQWFCSASEAGRQLNIPRRSIDQAINNTTKSGKQCKAYGKSFIKAKKTKKHI